MEIRGARRRWFNTGETGDRRDVSSWKSRAPSGTLCIVACLARMIAVDTPHRVMHTPPRSTSTVQSSEQKPPETSCLSRLLSPVCRRKGPVCPGPQPTRRDSKFLAARVAICYYYQQFTEVRVVATQQPAPGRSEMSMYREWLVQADHKASEAYDNAVMPLSGGALAISLTFIKEVVSKPKSGTLGSWAAGWACLAASVVAIPVSKLTSQWALRTAIRQVDEGQIRREHPGAAFGWATHVLNIVAAVTFFSGVSFLGWFAISNMVNADNRIQNLVISQQEESMAQTPKNPLKPAPPQPTPPRRGTFTDRPVQEGYAPPPPAKKEKGG